MARTVGSGSPCADLGGIPLYGGVGSGVRRRVLGVAAQPNRCLGYVAVLAIGLLAVAVWRKIWEDHKVYKAIWRNRVKIVGKLSQRPNSTDIFPDRIKGEPGHGYRYSIAVLLAAAVGAILFCLVFVIIARCA